MKIAICNETYRDWTFDDAFRHASQCGYDGIEIAPFTLHPDARSIPRTQCEQVVATARKHELQIIGLHWLLAMTKGLHLTSREATVRRATADYLARLAEVCDWLGGHLLVLGSPHQRNRVEGMSKDEADRLAIDCIRQVLPELERREITLALEPLGPEEGNFLLTAEWARDLIRQIGSPWVRLHLDVKAMSTEEKPIPDIIRESASDLVHFHTNDPNRRGPGMGDVDYQPILSTLQAVGYQGWLSVEVFDDSVPPETTATESIRYLKEQLALCDASP